MMTDVPRKMTVTTRAIFLRPTKLRWSRKENLTEGTETPQVDLLANAIDGARTANSLVS